MSTQVNPYVGPRSFETGEALYGRDREQRALAALLIAERIVLLHSPSGAGKTSLVRAGLLPHLVKENFNVLPVVRVNLEPPLLSEGLQANRYLLSTLLTLEEALPIEERLPLEKLATLSLDHYLAQRAPQDDTLLVFDQFEEIITSAASDREGKQAFFNEIGTALRNKKRWALFSMREDYLGALAPYLRPIPNRLATRFRLDLLGAEAALQAVQKPAKAAGVTFNPDAAKKLVDDLRRVQVQLPDGQMETQLGLYVEPVQLQVVCYRLWEKKKPEDTEISQKDLEGVGDVNESLASYYASSVSRVAESSDSPERSIREWFERKLITVEGLRSQVRMGAEMSEGLPNPAVRLLENAHIIRAEQRAGQTWFELAHDRLIEPVRADNKAWFEHNLSLFQRQAGLWLEQDRSEGLLLHGLELEQAEQEIKQIKPTPDEEAFLQACRLRRQREQRDLTQRRWIMIGLVASLLLFVVAVFFGISATNANQGLKLAVADANAARARAYELQITAQAASTEAVSQKLSAYAASTEAFNQKSTAEAASTQALANSYKAATAQANAYTEKARAIDAERKALEQSRLAQASSLVAQALLAQSKGRESLANLMAAAAIDIADNIRTRVQLLVSLANKNRLYLAQSINSGQIVDLNFASGGQRVVTSNFYNCDKNNYFLCGGGVVKIWSIDKVINANGEATATIRQDGDQIVPPDILDASTVSPDGQTIATAACKSAIGNGLVKCESENIQLWDVETRKNIGQPMIVTAEIFNEQAVHLLYSPDGNLLALSVNNPSPFNASRTSPMLILWDTRTFTEKGRIETGNGLTQMAFSADGNTLAYVSEKNLVLVDTASLKKTELTIPGNSGNLLSLAFSRDNKILAVGNNTGSTFLLNATTKEAIGQPLLNQSKVLTLAFSPDSTILVAGYFDATLIYWDVPSGIKLLPNPLFKHIDPNPDEFPIYALSFSQDGALLASSSNEIIIWDTSLKSWNAKACDIAGRNFTKSEWEQNFPGETYRVICPEWPAGK